MWFNRFSHNKISNFSFFLIVLNTFSSLVILSSYPCSRYNTNSNTMCEQRLQIHLELEEFRQTVLDSIRMEGIWALPLTATAEGTHRYECRSVRESCFSVGVRPSLRALRKVLRREANGYWNAKPHPRATCSKSAKRVSLVFPLLPNLPWPSKRFLVDPYSNSPFWQTFVLSVLHFQNFFV